MRARWTILAVLVAGATLVGSTALAQDGDDAELHPADRALIHGYDPIAMQLLWSTWLNDQESESEDTDTGCDIEDGGTYAYEETQDGVTITEEETDVATAGCQLTVTDVRGPNGQVNHGTVVSSFVHALKEAGIEGGIGCYVRVIAQSDYGKGEQQVKTSEVGNTEEAEGPSTVDLTVAEVDCGGDDESEDGGAETRASSGQRGSSGHGKPEHAGKGKPPWAGQGKPDHAGKGGPPPHAKSRG